MTEADAKFQVAFNTIYVKLREKAIKAKEKVDNKAIAAYYAKNKKRFAQPETRDLRRRADEDEGEGRRGQLGARERRQLEQGRQEVLDRPGLQGPRRLAARRRQGPAGEGLRRRASSRPTKGKLDGPGQDPVRLLRLRGQKISRPSSSR